MFLRLRHYKVEVLTLLLIISGVSTANANEDFAYMPYTQSDIEAKISCAAAISKAEFIAGKVGAFGSPRICIGVKADELAKWDCISLHINTSKNFAKSTDSCMQKISHSPSPH